MRPRVTSNGREIVPSGLQVGGLGSQNVVAVDIMPLVIRELRLLIEYYYIDRKVRSQRPNDYG